MLSFEIAPKCGLSILQSLSFLKNEDGYRKNATYDHTNHMVKNHFLEDFHYSKKMESYNLNHGVLGTLDQGVSIHALLSISMKGNGCLP